MTNWVITTCIVPGGFIVADYIASDSILESRWPMLILLKLSRSLSVSLSCVYMLDIILCVHIVAVNFDIDYTPYVKSKDCCYHHYCSFVNCVLFDTVSSSATLSP